MGFKLQTRRAGRLARKFKKRQAWLDMMNQFNGGGYGGGGMNSGMNNGRSGGSGLRYSPTINNYYYTNSNGTEGENGASNLAVGATTEEPNAAVEPEVLAQELGVPTNQSVQPEEVEQGRSGINGIYGQRVYDDGQNSVVADTTSVQTPWHNKEKLDKFPKTDPSFQRWPKPIEATVFPKRDTYDFRPDYDFLPELEIIYRKNHEDASDEEVRDWVEKVVNDGSYKYLLRQARLYRRGGYIYSREF